MSFGDQEQRKPSQDEVNRRIEYVFDHPEIIQAALTKGVEDARRQYAQAGLAMANWKDGKVIWVDPVTLNEVERPSSVSVRQSDSSN